jgi:eukaryotic-like serine/threonine-protein kinase
MSQAAASPEHELILGRYRALRPLGSGGSGSVWLARDERENRDVALKVVPKEGKAGARAEREAVAVSRLRHGNCARVFTVDRDERHVYVAYEYIPGCTLREAIRAGMLDDRRSVEAAAQVLDALAHAHARRIVHRDVKPANLLLVEGSDVSIRLLDFGLALMDDADTLTAAGDVPGTLAYIAPERLAGEEATGAADVWAVGVILWETLAGQQPFWSPSPLDTAKLIGSGAPPLAAARPDLPRELTKAVDSALALDPAQRPDPKRLAARLRRSVDEAERRREQRPAASLSVIRKRVTHAALAAAYVIVATALLPFFPQGLAIGLAAAAALGALVEPRVGLALALAVPILPAGDVSLGLALVYLPVAVVWLALFWRDARHGFYFLAGPLLASISALPLLPLVGIRSSGRWRQALVPFAGVLVAGLVAGLRGDSLPFGEGTPPLGLGIAGSESPSAVASALLYALLDHPLLLVEAVLLGAATLALPVVRACGLWAVAGFGAVFLGLGLLLPVAFGAAVPSALPFVLATCGLCAALAAPLVRRASLNGPEIGAPPQPTAAPGPPA